jgi:HAD domain in Swiss Army Knife RNA repair proteins
MKVIFLDIDGVLNCEKTPNPRKFPYVVDRKLLTRLKTLLERTGAKVVLSSSWRLDPIGLFAAKHWGVPFIDVCPDMPKRSRRDEVLSRPGYDIDIEAVLALVPSTVLPSRSTPIPGRLDLDWRWHQRALDLVCMMSINPDAHSTRELDLTHWGVEMARKGGVPASRVLNCLRLQALSQYLHKRKRLQARAA